MGDTWLGGLSFLPLKLSTSEDRRICQFGRFRRLSSEDFQLSKILFYWSENYFISDYYQYWCEADLGRWQKIGNIWRLLRLRYLGISSYKKFSDFTEDCDCISKEHFYIIFGRVTSTFFTFSFLFFVAPRKLNGKIHEILIYLMRSSYILQRKEKYFLLIFWIPHYWSYSVVISNIMEHIRNR